MGLIESIKKGTGVGLSHAEHYVRAFEQGVLLGPAKYGEARQLFDEAARRAGQAGDTSLQARAAANAALYGFIATGDVRYLAPLAQALPYVPEIEVIGSATELMPTGGLQAEVSARLVEAEIAQLGGADPRAIAAAHERAAAAFRAFFSAPLVTYRYQASDGHVESAQSRFFFHQGLASWHHALAAMSSSPEVAAELMGKAISSFRQCGDARWADDAQAWLSNCRMKRTCWLCHREVQGATVHFKSYPAHVTPYTAAVVGQLGQDGSTLDERGFVVLCATCGSVVERQAEAYANLRAQELRALYDAQLAGLAAQVAALTARLSVIR